MTAAGTITFPCVFHVKLPYLHSTSLVVRLKNIPIILAGNKCDLKERKVTKLQGLELAKQWNVPFYETSAKTLINNKIIFFEMIRLITKQRKNNEIIRANTIKSKKKNKCYIL